MGTPYGHCPTVQANYFLVVSHSKPDGQFVDSKSKKIAISVPLFYESVQEHAAAASQSTEGSSYPLLVNMSQLYVKVVEGEKKQRLYELDSKAPSFSLSHASSNSSASTSTTFDEEALRWEIQVEMDKKYGGRLLGLETRMEEMTQMLLRQGMVPPAVPSRPSATAPRPAGASGTPDANLDDDDDDSLFGDD